jgi:hypothetical protein
MPIRKLRDGYSLTMPDNTVHLGGTEVDLPDDECQRLAYMLEPTAEEIKAANAQADEQDPDPEKAKRGPGRPKKAEGADETGGK